MRFGFGRHAMTIASGLITFVKGRNPTYGTEDMGFIQNTTLPAYSTIGAGKNINRQVHLYQPPQVFVNDAQVINGLGGLQAGSIYGTPLAPNPNNGASY